MEFFHPYFYGSQIWGQSNQSLSKMEKLQNKALRIMNFKPLRYSVTSVNIPTVRTKTSGTNSIQSKSVNTWNNLNKLFIKIQFVNQKINYCKYLIKSYFIKGYV